MHTVRSIATGLFVMVVTSSAWATNCDGFADVDTSTSYCSAVVYVKDHGITLGCTGTAYCPDAYVTRAQMALFLQRMGQADASNILGDHTTSIAGGTHNEARGEFAVIGGGTMNTADGDRSGVLGGSNNQAPGALAAVGGGYGNLVEGRYGTVPGGYVNLASGELSAVGGGQVNTASGFASTVIGGDGNSASGTDAAIAGGYSNTASATLSFAAGANALANESGCAVFALWSTSTAFGCNSWTNVFRIGADNGMSVDYGAQTGNGNSNDYVYIGPKFAGHAISTGTGAFLSTGGTWTNSSDRAEKTDLNAVDPRAVLDRVVALPMDTWRYKAETGQRHLGPMAQDFYAAFGLGEDDKHITTIDEGGVALAAIQGLNAKLEARDATIADQAHELAAVSAQLAAVASQLQRVEARLH